MTYTDPGATANDSCDGSIGVIQGGSVDTSMPGTYTLTYNATDASGNSAPQQTRTVTVVDTESPVITLVEENGSETATVECCTEYEDPGATATDVCDGSVGVEIDASDVDTSKTGEYTVYYTAEDGAGNKTEISRTVVVVDTRKPVITMNGSDEVSVECKEDYSDAGATADDCCDGDLTERIATDESSVDTDVPGTYTVTYDVSDDSANAADTVTRTVIVEDTIPPEITLRGESSMTVECGDEFEDPGATAYDDCDGDVTDCGGTGEGVDTTCTGAYTIVYNATDSSGNIADTVTRTVTVADTEPPVISMNGESSVIVECKETYVDAGATAMDMCEGDLTNSIVTVNPVDSAIPGTYYVTYNVSDSSGNVAIEVSREVTVIEDTIAPVITLLGENPVTIECGGEYKDAGAVAIDNCDSNVNVIVGGDINTEYSVGTFVITYNASDSIGNAAEEVTRTVNVVDTIVPVIGLLGEPYIAIEEGGVYVDAGAQAWDTCDGNITERIEVGGDIVDTSSPGIYIITYNVKDESGNAAIEVTRKVVVEGYFSLWGITHRRKDDPDPRRDEEALPVLDTETIPRYENFEFNLEYVGSIYHEIRWTISFRSGENWETIEGSGNTFEYEGSTLGEGAVAFYVDRNDNDSFDLGEPMVHTSVFVYKDYSIRNVKYALTEGVNSLTDPFSGIMEQASIDLSKKHDFGPLVNDYRVAVQFIGNDTVEIIHGDDEYGNYCDIYTYAQWRHLIDITPEIDLKVINNFYIRPYTCYLVFQCWEENLLTPNTATLGLSLIGEPYSTIISWPNCSTRTKWNIIIHEYVHCIQWIYGWSHYEDGTGAYIMDPAPGDQSKAASFNTKEILE